MKSENIADLAKALAAAQSEIKSAVKDSENPFFKSTYADLASVWAACRDALTKNGIAIVQAPGFEGDTVYLETVLMHASGQWIDGRLPVRPVKNDPQGMGSAITYARRYGLAAMVGVAPDDDDDGNAASQGKAVNKPDKPAPKATGGFRITPPADAAIHADDPFAGPTLAEQTYTQALEALDAPGVDLALWTAAYKAHMPALSDEQQATLRAKYAAVKEARKGAVT